MGVWLLPALTSLDRVASALVGVAWLTAVVLLLRRLSAPVSEDDRARLEGELFVAPAERVTWASQFVTLLTLSSVIAALGLLADSAAVVIGAMVVAPLMSPLMSLAGALTLTRPVRIVESIVAVVGGSLLTIFTSAFISWIVPGTGTTSELLARTQPELTDLGIALAAGAAGAYVTVRPSALGALPGVAIAVALVPPLATAGVMLELDRREDAEQAAILFVTNLCAIVLSASIVFLIVGLTASAEELRSRGRLQVGLGVAIAATIAVMAPLAHNSVARHDAQVEVETVEKALSIRLRRAGSTLEDVVIDRRAGDVAVTVEVAGPRPPDTTELARAVAEELGEPVVLELLWRYGDRARSTT